MNSRGGGPPALQALLLVRRQIAGRREAELARAAQARREAEAALAAAAERCRAQAQRLAAARLGRGLEPDATAAGLQREQAWQARLAAELEALRAGEQAARQCLDDRARAFGEAQQALARARADVDAADRLWQAWDQARRALEQRRAEDELADLVAARRHRR